MEIEDDGAPRAPVAAARPVGRPKRPYHRSKAPPQRTHRLPPETPPEPVIARAAVRAPVRERKRKGGQLADKFAFPLDQIPDGSSYEWKRLSTFGQSDPSYDVMLREQGWLPVDAARHPSFMPEGHKGAIIRDGQILMERPIELTQEAQDEDRRAARLAVRIKEEQMGATPANTLTREHPSARANTYVHKSIEPGAIPE